MSQYTLLKSKIQKKKARICVVGLGYVGLPLAAAFARKGFSVFGFDVNVARLRRLQKGASDIIDVDSNVLKRLLWRKKISVGNDPRFLKNCDVVVFCVPTPLRKVKVPDISYLVKATKLLAKHFEGTKLIVAESTSYPTTTREVILPILEKKGLTMGKDFFLCFSPERINPGDKKHTLTRIPKIVGGLSVTSGSLAKTLYGMIIRRVYQVSSPEVAETAKLYENTFRLVNIALANEFALVCNKLNISIWEVIEAAKTKPFGFMPFYPGPGIGGHCIPCDPLYLSWKAKKIGFKTKMIDLAAYINRFMPSYIADRVLEYVRRKGTAAGRGRVLIVGVTYKRDVKDLRESPALDIIEQLRKGKNTVDYSDPLIPYLKIDDIDLKSIALIGKNIKSYDCVVIVTDHAKVNYELIRKNATFIYDTRNVYKRDYVNVRRI